MKSILNNNIETIRERIDQACQRVGRDPGSIQIVMATKTVKPERILEAAQYGYSKAGENRVQEAEKHISQMGERAGELEWHFIGHLQSNKVNNVAQFASMIQSIDRMKIVRRLNKRLKKIDKTMDVLIQVNVSGEESKYGLNPADTLQFIEKASGYERINIKGLMTIGLFSDDWPGVRAGFRQLKELYDEIADGKIEGVQMKHLSMGMTNDFELAIEEGANMLRLGRAIFGERDTPDSYYWPGINASVYSPES